MNLNKGANDGIPVNSQGNTETFFILRLKINSWRGARVVESDGLENRCARKCTVGSNPTLSARG